MTVQSPFPDTVSMTYHCNNAHVPVMVVSSRFDGKEIFLYVLHDKLEAMTRADLDALAENAAQAYFDRWSIETMFLRIKQDFRIEDARVRTFKHLENIVALAALAHYFVTHHLPMVEAVYSRMKKAIKDTFDKVISGTHAFLLNFRELLSYSKVSYIKGRPRKRHKDLERQMTFAF